MFCTVWKLENTEALSFIDSVGLKTHLQHLKKDLTSHFLLKSFWSLSFLYYFDFLFISVLISEEYKIHNLSVLIIMFPYLIINFYTHSLFSFLSVFLWVFIRIQLNALSFYFKKAMHISEINKMYQCEIASLLCFHSFLYFFKFSSASFCVLSMLKGLWDFCLSEKWSANVILYSSKESADWGDIFVTSIHQGQ